MRVLESLVALLETVGLQTYAFDSPRRFLRFYRSEMPGCLVLDVGMPQRNGLALYEQLLHNGKHRLPAIFIAAQADVSTAVEAMKMGAFDFLQKPIDGDSLLDVVKRALAMDAEWRKREMEYASLAFRMQQLTSRESDTLELLQNGESNKSMASKLGGDRTCHRNAPVGDHKKVASGLRR